MNDTTTKDHVHAELVTDDQETALAPLQSGTFEAPVLGPLAFQGDAVAIIERMGQTLQALQAALIRTTQPEDWIVQGTGLALLGNAGCNRCAPLLGLEIDPLPGRDLAPQRIERDNGAVEYTIAAWAFSRVLGRGEEIEVTRSSKEQFLGRQTDAAGNIVRKDGTAPHDPDHRSAVRSLLLSKAVRKLGGLGNVSETRLLEIFGPTAKNRFQRGHGAGSGQERKAQGVAEEGVPEKARALWDEILRRTGGDEGAASDVLREITSYPAAKDGSYNAFAGVKSWQQMAKAKGVEIAWKKLRGHSVFGDKAQEREPGEDKP